MNEYAQARRDGVEEDVKRIESFKNKMVLQMRIKQQLTDDQHELVCKVIDAQIHLLNMKPT